nr:unnamed protein product [Digitaria exilis]
MGASSASRPPRARYLDPRSPHSSAFSCSAGETRAPEQRVEREAPCNARVRSSTSRRRQPESERDQRGARGEYRYLEVLEVDGSVAAGQRSSPWRGGDLASGERRSRCSGGVRWLRRQRWAPAAGRGAAPVARGPGGSAAAAATADGERFARGGDREGETYG